jgi:NAD(P)-dependent dehydrogenase (short-subunit alcohol dehydrogenase family)
MQSIDLIQTASNNAGKNIVILGGGAIGLALVQQLLAANAQNHCIATWQSREPIWRHPRLTWFQLNATKEAEMESFAKIVKDLLGTIDWIINTIGLLHNYSNDISQGRGPEKRIADFQADFFINCMSTNVAPTLLAAKWLGPLMKKNNPCLFAAISAKVGSITDNRLGGWYSYRASKAALNMVLKTLSIEWQMRYPKFCVAAIHPGTTQSNLSAPFSANLAPEQLFTAQISSNYIIATLERLTVGETGRFWSWNGEEIPW